MNLLVIGDLQYQTTLFVVILLTIGAFIPFIVAYALANKELSLGGELPRDLKKAMSKTGWFWAIGLAGIVFLIAKAYINSATDITNGVFSFGREIWFWLCLLIIIANGVINLVIVIKWIREAQGKDMK